MIVDDVGWSFREFWWCLIVFWWSFMAGLCSMVFSSCLMIVDTYLYIHIHTVYIMIYLVVTVLKNLLVTWDHRGPNHFRDFQQIQRSTCSGGCPVRCSNWFSPGNRHCKFQELRDLRHLQSLLRSFWWDDHPSTHHFGTVVQHPAHLLGPARTRSCFARTPVTRTPWDLFKEPHKLGPCKGP